MNNKYYKVLDSTSLSPSANFDYTPYLPQNGKSGEWLPRIESPKLREKGYYASKYWNMWYKDGARIYEVELKDVENWDEYGTQQQVCCAQMRLLKDVTDDVLPQLSHSDNEIAEETSKYNIGVLNTGMYNLGNCNVGKFNTGNHNTGNKNSGDFNTGDSNTGIDNVGDNNSGSCNVGSHNVGHSNTGNKNNGSYNSGSFNRGHANSGSFNNGSHNAGKWNIGNNHCGYFNTEEPTIRMFNKPTNLKTSEIRLPKWLNTIDVKEAFLKASQKEVEMALLLPNFDFDIFERITGISKVDFEKKLEKTLEDF